VIEKISGHTSKIWYAFFTENGTQALTVDPNEIILWNTEDWT
jgi:hypothetical protein